MTSLGKSSALLLAFILSATLIAAKSPQKSATRNPRKTERRADPLAPLLRQAGEAIEKNDYAAAVPLLVWSARGVARRGGALRRGGVPLAAETVGTWERHAGAACAPLGEYRRREPERTVLHGLVAAPCRRRRPGLGGEVVVEDHR